MNIGKEENVSAKKGKSGKSWIGWAAGGIAAIGSLSYLKRLANVAKEIVIVTRSNFDRAMLVYVIEVTIKNPISQSIRIKQPFAELRYKDSVIASSTPSSAIIAVPADGVSQTTLRISFDRDKIFATAPGVILTLAAGGKIPITATTHTGLVTMLGTTEIKKEDTWQLGT